MFCGYVIYRFMDHDLPSVELPDASLLSHCLTCKSGCCKNKSFTATAQEHDTIIAKGYPDHFAKVTLSDKGEFYVLDYERSRCSYLADDNTCTIEDSKPDTCRAYPARAYYYSNNHFGYFAFDPECPAKQAMTDEQKSSALFYAEKKKIAMPISKVSEVMRIYEYAKMSQHNMLEFSKAKVELPTAKPE